MSFINWHCVNSPQSYTFHNKCVILCYKNQWKAVGSDLWAFPKWMHLVHTAKMQSSTSLSEADRMSQDVLCINHKATGITCLNRNWNDSTQVHQWHRVFTQFYSQLNRQLSILSKKANFISSRQVNSKHLSSNKFLSLLNISKELYLNVN